MFAFRMKYFFKSIIRVTITGCLLHLLLATTGCVNSKSPVKEGSQFASSDSLIKNALHLALKSGRLPSKQYISDGYKQQQFHFLWTIKGHLTDAGHQALALLSNAEIYGLISEEYDAGYLSQLSVKLSGKAPVEDFDLLATFDVQLSSKLLLFISHLHNGRIDPFTFKPVYSLHKSSINLFEALIKAINAPSFTEEILINQPQGKPYLRLQKALSLFLKRNSNIEYGPLPSYKKDPLNFSRLMTGLLAANNTISEWKDSTALSLQPVIKNSALQRFQHFHNLPETGIANPETMEALAIPLCTRYQQLVINMERWRWEEAYSGDYIFINIPTFSLNIMRNDTVLKKHKVIVGLPEHPSPTLSSQLNYIVLNPDWSIPYSISTKEILPILKENPSYLDQKNYILFNSDNKEIDPYTIDWETVKEDNFKFTIKQGSGDDNALGLVKFLFKNPYSVYLHDTPFRSLFEKEERAFSHGCIRVENPLQLAIWLLNHDSVFVGLKKIQEIIDKKKTQTLQLKHPPALHIKYFTCMATASGIFFYKDIYDLDEKIIDAFFK
jgi:murein L,D-transpeptidase YcbB/YkuD